MSKTITIAGLDPSMRNFGMVKAALDLTTGKIEIIDLVLTETSTSPKNKTVRKNSEDLNRARVLSQAVNIFLHDVDMAFVEIPVGSQTARAMASYGMCIGILSQITIPMIQVTPSEVKIAATGSKTATKLEMISWATDKYPDAAWLRQGVRYLAKNEHLADATAAIHAGLATDEFRQATVFLK